MSKEAQAIATIKDLRENHPDYHNRLYEKCQTCQNILSCYECDICEDFDMYEPVREEALE